MKLLKTNGVDSHSCPLSRTSLPVATALPGASVTIGGEYGQLMNSLTIRFEGTESNGLEYGDKPGGFVKSPGSVVVVTVVLRDADND